MIIFRNREHGEAEFAFDEDLKFKAAVRCSSLLGQWASQKLGLSGPAADAYTKQLVGRYLEDSDTDGVFKKIRVDFDQRGIAQSDHQIHRTIDEFMSRALAELRANN